MTRPSRTVQPAANRSRSWLSWLKQSSVQFSCAIFLLLLALSLGGLNYLRESQSASSRAKLRQATAAAAMLIEQDLTRAFASAQILKSLIRSAGSIQDFDRVAAEIIKLNPLVAAMGLAPDGVVRAIYPMEENEAALGRDLLQDPAASNETQESIRKRAMVLARPHQFLRGGIGAMARLPVFIPIDSSTKSEKLWGFIFILVRTPDIEAHLLTCGIQVADAGFNLSTIDSASKKREIFFPFPAPTLSNPVSAEIHLPERNWTISVGSAPPSAINPRLADLAAIASCLIATAACVSLLRSQRRSRSRNYYYQRTDSEHAWNHTYDDAQRQLESLRGSQGWTALLVVQAPRRNEPLARIHIALPDPYTEAFCKSVRSPDLCLKLGNGEYLLLAHGLPDRDIACRVLDRLHACVNSIAAKLHPGQPLPFSTASRIFIQPKGDPCANFAAAMVELKAASGSTDGFSSGNIRAAAE